MNNLLHFMSITLTACGCNIQLKPVLGNARVTGYHKQNKTGHNIQAGVPLFQLFAVLCPLLFTFVKLLLTIYRVFLTKMP